MFKPFYCPFHRRWLYGAGVQWKVLSGSITTIDLYLYLWPLCQRWEKENAPLLSFPGVPFSIASDCPTRWHSENMGLFLACMNWCRDCIFCLVVRPYLGKISPSSPWESPPVVTRFFSL
jgi:hypothetical protein